MPSDPLILPKLPVWATAPRVDTVENVAFRSGAALTVLNSLLVDARYGVPVKLLANRLALTAATATSKLEGRLARKADIRDAYHLTPDGSVRGPDGDLLAFWRESVRLRLNDKDWCERLADFVGLNFAQDVAGWVETGTRCESESGPLAVSASVMRMVLNADDRAERIACLLSDVILARALHWDVALPISAQCLSKAVLRDLTEGEDGAELAVQTRMFTAIKDLTYAAGTLAHRAHALRKVAPKLRAKGSDAGVALFLSEDAVAPSTMLSPMIQGSAIAMTDRAARRFCDRLVELGVVHELTGRQTFRLYGLAQ